MAAVAMAADQNLDPAALTQEQPRRHRIGMVVVTPRTQIDGRSPWL
jgi:hypothetical protein